MNNIEPATIILILINALITYQGLRESSFFDKYAFHVDEILFNKDYKRLITSGFLHANWMHFSFNVLTLYFFGNSLETALGIPWFIVLYFSSLIGGNLLALYFHRNHPNYRAIGASGAVCGVVFASIGLFPSMEIGFILIPPFIPAWLYGLAFVLWTIYGIRNQKGNIGHEAHLGGGIVGLLIAIALKPYIMKINLIPILLILVPAIIFLIIIVLRPHLLLIPGFSSKSTPQNAMTFEDRYNSDKISKQNELDQLLDKIKQKGYDKLTKKEKNRLDELSR